MENLDALLRFHFIHFTFLSRFLTYQTDPYNSINILTNKRNPTFESTKMSQAVSNVSPLFPLSSVKTRNVRFPVFSKPINGGGCFSHSSKNSLKAMAGDARDNLDHLQRATKLQQQQAQPRKRAAPAPPIGKFEFPLQSFNFEALGLLWLFVSASASSVFIGNTLKGSVREIESNSFW